MAVLALHWWVPWKVPAWADASDGTIWSPMTVSVVDAGSRLLWLPTNKDTLKLVFQGFRCVWILNARTSVLEIVLIWLLIKESAWLLITFGLNLRRYGLFSVAYMLWLGSVETLTLSLNRFEFIMLIANYKWDLHMTEWEWAIRNLSKISKPKWS